MLAPPREGMLGLKPVLPEDPPPKLLLRMLPDRLVFGIEKLRPERLGLIEPERNRLESNRGTVGDETLDRFVVKFLLVPGLMRVPGLAFMSDLSPVPGLTPVPDRRFVPGLTFARPRVLALKARFRSHTLLP
ncbi:MAG: hypothetical protein HY914_10240 [Desulfomonile tiedjei]|nr:hypothetical protein [Desulfomonile tiedjei]